MEIVNLDQVEPFRTKDGSEIRELLAHRNSSIRNQSLAEASIPVGGSTMEHYHAKAEEIYFITHGVGRMRLGQAEREVRPGDAIAIPPSERRLLFRLQAEHALYPARSQSPPAPAHNPLSLPVSLPHPRLAPSADTLVMVVWLLPGGTQVCPPGRSQPPDSGSSPGGNRPLRLRHHHKRRKRATARDSSSSEFEEPLLQLATSAFGPLSQA